MYNFEKNLKKIVEIFLCPHPLVELFIALNEIYMLMQVIEKIPNHGMTKIQKYGERIKRVRKTP